MSLQDDYYDLKDYLKDHPLEKSFDRIWFAFVTYENIEMVREGKMSEADYLQWIFNHIGKL